MSEAPAAVSENVRRLFKLSGYSILGTRSPVPHSDAFVAQRETATGPTTGRVNEFETTG